jgi:2,3-bisphosphoglycerate-independent phosphoglycerate mutase
MKYIILIGDGMADRPIKELGHKTCLQKARTPNMDMLAREGEAGKVKTIPEGFDPALARMLRTSPFSDTTLQNTTAEGRP